MNFAFAAPALACAFAATAAAAAAAAATPADHRAELLRVMTAHRAGVALPTVKPAGGAVDQTPPQLLSFTVTPPTDLADPLAQIRFDVDASDDLTGVLFASAFLTGPHGQQVYVNAQALPYGTLRAAIHGVGFVTPYTEPGAWTVSSVAVSDYAGNTAYYVGDTLAAHGNVAFTLASTRPKLVDRTLPTVVSGVVVTQTLLLSTSQPGMPAGAAPSAEVDFVVTDAGDPKASGVYGVSSTWCKLDRSACVYLDNSDLVLGDKRTTIRDIGGIGSFLSAGEYVLEWLHVSDHAGNYANLLGKDFGGTTDYSQLLPAGHSFTITP